ncbi:DUF2797 domain-containing protein [Sulfoacidibacillus thermotolerans]|uniref:DUF2797 domain-containing protein n=1 Tax=Sulfoacidibacillus thermotolerans TaxID=1765684 RepID=A0A2U3DCN0_SULT2|nr:DUF2797 domain-containing protein [Sulfoacidibacillus thermotolerans]PWI59043.1 hypothetical protein BM613_00045 [Sulfoacidibacillus thermotolerans]
MRGFTNGLTHLVDRPIQYQWNLGDEEVALNQWIGKEMHIEFLGEKRCIACGRKVNKLYQNGYCYPCVTTLAETDLCIVKPHECHFANGTCRDEEFATTHCMIPHYVYLAVSSQVKVGLTRKHRQWTRWIDQGAVRAMLLAELPTRKAAGEFEMEVAKELPDKTDWRKMVQGITSDIDLKEVAAQVKERLPALWSEYLLADTPIYDFLYPVIPETMPKARSISLEKQSVEGKLLGIRGQYLLFEQGCVNIKKHAGMFLEVTAR